jgi:hypothetical protein
MNKLLEIDEGRVRALLAPLDRVEPVFLPEQRRPRRRLLIALAAGTALVVVTGFAVAGAFGPLHEARLEPLPSLRELPGTTLLACQLIGLPAGHAAQLLGKEGIKIEWRYDHWGDQTVTPGSGTVPGAVGGGYTTAPASAPPESVVSDILVDKEADRSVFVFVQARTDPNAPTIVRPACPNP